MNTPTAIDPDDFERLLSRNIKLPLIGGVFGAVVFVGLILFLLNTIGWVEHTDRVTRAASELQRRTIDMETGVRGFLITGERSFLEPYQSALTRLKGDTVGLRNLVSDNPQQVERIDRLATLQTAWLEFANGMIAARDASSGTPDRHAPRRRKAADGRHARRVHRLHGDRAGPALPAQQRGQQHCLVGRRACSCCSP